MKLTDKDREDLQYAKHILESPGFAVNVMNYIGIPIEKGLRCFLPAGPAPSRR